MLFHLKRFAVAELGCSLQDKETLQPKLFDIILFHSDQYCFNSIAKDNFASFIGNPYYNCP